MLLAAFALAVAYVHPQEKDAFVEMRRKVNEGSDFWPRLSRQ
jgi:hypothetical protein